MWQLIVDDQTGNVVVQARDHRRYTLDELAEAEARAATGDQAALKLLETLDQGPGGGDLATLLHDCPECRAALARGEQPMVLTGDALTRALRAAQPLRRPDRRTRRAEARRAARGRK